VEVHQAHLQPPSEFLEVDAVDENNKKVYPTLSPEYEQWFAMDSQVRSYLFSSLSKDVFSQVASSTTAADL
jgi:hypothetical protein